MAAHIELERFITYASACYAFNRARKEQAEGNYAWANIGMRAAKARDPKLLKALDLAANAMYAEEERQRGHSMRTTDVHAEARYSTYTQMWRESYRMVDEGKAGEVPHLMWMYGAGAFLAGYQL